MVTRGGDGEAQGQEVIFKSAGGAKRFFGEAAKGA